jgi:pimeloyl-ACP methyl ester carboxylesterase
VQQWLELIAGAPPSSADGFRDHVRACVAHDAIDRLGVVTAPTLVTAGEFDLVCPPDHADALRAAIPHASYHVWEGVGPSPLSRLLPRSERLCSRSYAVRPSAATKRRHRLRTR